MSLQILCLATFLEKLQKKKKGIEKFKASVNYGWDKNTSWN